MLTDFLTTIGEWLLSFRTGISDTTLQGTIEYLIATFIVSMLILTFFQSTIYVLKKTLEITKMVAKVIGLLIILVLVVVILRMILDHNRPCQTDYEPYFTRCQIM